MEEPDSQTTNDDLSSSAKDLQMKSLQQKRKDRRAHEYLSKFQARKTAGTQTSLLLVYDARNAGDDSSDSHSNGDSPDEDDDDEHDDDLPLDMTTSRKTPPEVSCKENMLPNSAAATVLQRHTPLIVKSSAQQQRPSVITRVSAPVNYAKRKAHSSAIGLNAKHGLPGMYDPVIDEHFRRSLGKDYPEYLSTPSVSNTISDSGLSVDDHFAKALGDTWVRLQKSDHPKTSPTTAKAAAGATDISPPASPPPIVKLHVVST